MSIKAQQSPSRTINNLPVSGTLKPNVLAPLPQSIPEAVRVVKEALAEISQVVLGTMSAIAAEALPLQIDEGQEIGADLYVPDRAIGLVVLAHGSGSSRFSSRNRAVAESLQARGLGTLLADLLTRQEDSVDASWFVRYLPV